LAGLLIGCGQSDLASAPNGGAASSEGFAAMGGEVLPPASPPPPPAPITESAATRSQAADAVDADAPEEAQNQPSQPGGVSQPGGPNPVLYLAYTYNIGLELPSQRLNAVLDHHVQLCQQAGPRLCQLVGSNVSGDPESYLSGYVSLRAEPNWLRTFMGGLEAEADAAGGRVKTSTTQSEDLTRQIVDTEARMRALTALRDRLQELLRSRPGRLSDLLEVERELARVQGEVDATQSNLAVMRTRVSMSELTLNYESSARPVGSDTFQPLADAFANFLRIVVMGFAAIITIIAGLLPFAIVLGFIAWLALKWRRRNGGRFWRRNAPPPPPVAPPANE